MTTKRWFAVAALVAVALAGCGDDDPVVAEGPTTTVDPVAPSEVSSPFAVGAVPARYTPVAVGRGEAEATWGWDCCGTVEPYVVLSPDGTPDHRDVVVVSATGYAGYEGGLEQASAGYTQDPEPVEVDGDEGLYTAPDPEGGWADLVVARGEDLAVRVTSPDATVDELTAVAEATVLAHGDAAQHEAPTVPEPPDGLVVVGTASVDAVLARYPFVADDPPGPASAHAVAWTAGAAGPSGDPDSLIVATLPGTAGDAAAMAVASGEAAVASRTLRDVEGRPAQIVDWEQYDTPVRSLWLASSWGDLVVVTASGTDLPTADELVAVAASVHPTDSTTWEAAVAAGTAPA